MRGASTNSLQQPPDDTPIGSEGSGVLDRLSPVVALALPGISTIPAMPSAPA
jgi:hypothetical protein